MMNGRRRDIGATEVQKEMVEGGEKSTEPWQLSRRTTQQELLRIFKESNSRVNLEALKGLLNQSNHQQYVYAVRVDF